jgi:hypothetical protein
MRDIVLERLIAKLRRLFGVHDTVREVGAVGLRHENLSKRPLCHRLFLNFDRKGPGRYLDPFCQPLPVIHDQAKAKRLRR